MTETPFERLARRASERPSFLGFHLDEYARLAGLDPAGLAARLGCDPALLADVRLCRAPRSDPAGFREDVTCVAARFGLDPVALAEAAKAGFAVLRYRDAPADGPGVLLAARDRHPPAGEP